MADNGPMSHNLPPGLGMAETIYRGGKGDFLEGGVRVPASAWWPGVIKPGQLVGDMIHETDLFTTFARLAGAMQHIPRDRYFISHHHFAGLDLIFTGRDAAHSFLCEKDRPEFRERLKGRFIYHCGPVVKKTGDEYAFVSAGPTTSAREEPYQADVFKNYGVRGVIGKGGMGPKTLAGCKESGAVYLHALGGAGALTAASVKKVHSTRLRAASTA